ncbi:MULTISPECIES: ABC transporter substrate-binding protein [Exiguobacterium]|uniref:ABC transporter substrate-binding protein n=3 Tax=Exiguobacterium antarcticum TaxID=132920 RepID=A0ABT6R1J4_9BACL|nr:MULTISPECIES: ABC transporter substrate-binding protein [Exiguobacterium]AFS70101.1 extracellular solute-binding protein [Exiguobacterium antarcticum B7]MDI3234715.1 ABC transporter substrate-binding protein [Exiguobacterium antarcticum]
MMKPMIGLAAMGMLLAGCASPAAPVQEKVLGSSYTSIEKEANATTVRMYMWGGDEGINAYIDEYVTPKLKKEHQITLERVPIETADLIQKLRAEKKAGKKTGVIDVVWINGDNFRNAKKDGLLYGEITKVLPNMKYVDPQAQGSDSGTATDELEAAWGKVQYTFHYDQGSVANPPKDLQALKSWVKQNPGKFTYPEVTDFTGNAFVRHVMYGVESKETLKNPKADFKKTWAYLNELKPYLWKEGKTYPKTLAQLDQLYAKGTVSFTMGFNERRAEQEVKSGTFPKETRPLILDDGSIASTHFLSIPFNAPNPNGALVTINTLLSAEAQLKKFDATYWGDGTSLDLATLGSDAQMAFENVPAADSTPKPTEFKGKVRAELDPELFDVIRKEWPERVAR